MKYDNAPYRDLDILAAVKTMPAWYREMEGNIPLPVTAADILGCEWSDIPEEIRSLASVLMLWLRPEDEEGISTTQATSNSRLAVTVLMVAYTLFREPTAERMS